jgi:hypothetical protein
VEGTFLTLSLLFFFSFSPLRGGHCYTFLFSVVLFPLRFQVAREWWFNIWLFPRASLRILLCKLGGLGTATVSCCWFLFASQEMGGILQRKVLGVVETEEKGAARLDT